MKNQENTEPDQDQPATENTNKPGDFVIGLVTFIVFIIFMTVWMYFFGDGKVSH